MDAQDIIKRVDKLKAGRANWDSLWQEAAKYCLPSKTNFTVTKVSGSNIDSNVYDATAKNSLQVLAASLHSYLTNPASKWFALRTKDKDLMDLKNVKSWLRACEEIIYNVLNSSNFAQEVHEGYLDLGGFGTFALYEEEDEKDFVRFYCRPLREIYIAEGFDGRVDTVYRCFKMTARQAKQKWPNSCGEAVTKACEMQDYEKEFDFIHVIVPRHERDVAKKDKLNMPYASIHIEVSQKHKCDEGGYKEFPFFVPRFSKLAGDVWGYSPAMISMPDIKMLNAMSKTIIRAAQKIVDPPVEMPNNAYLMPINMGPSGINFRIQGTADDGIKAIETGGDIPVGLEMVQDLRQSIQKAFFVDIFLIMAQERQQQTATEVNVREGEKMLILGPVLGRLMAELLNPLINRTFSLLSERGVFPPIPEELIDKEYVVEYISPLAKAQKFQEINSIQNLITFVGNMAAVFTGATDKINVDKTVDDAADIYGVNPEIVLDAEDVGAIREQKARAVQAQMEMEAAQSVASTAKDGTQAIKNLQPPPEKKAA